MDSVLQFEFQNPSIDQYLDYKEANKVVEVVEAVAVQVGKEAKEREEKQVHWVVNLEVASLEAQAEVTEEVVMGAVRVTAVAAVVDVKGRVAASMVAERAKAVNVKEAVGTLMKAGAMAEATAVRPRWRPRWSPRPLRRWRSPCG